MSRRIWIQLSALFLVVTLISGCWNTRELEHMFYAYVLGVDFKKGEYTVYVQILNFAALGKQEGGTDNMSGSWVGKGRGKSIQEAMHDLYNTTQRRIYWGHLSSLIASEAVLKRDVHVLLDEITRFNEFRYILWVFGTESPIEDLLLVSPILENSPVYSQLGDPMDVYRQSSLIRPLRLNQFIISLRERGKTPLLPMLGLSTGDWSDNKKQYDALYINGLSIIEDGKMVALLPKEKVKGIRWLEKETKRTPLVVNGGRDATASLIFEHHKPEVHARTSNGKAVFDIDLKLRATIVELGRSISEEELKQRAAATIRDEIMETYKTGLKKRTDVLNLLDVLYRKHYKEWKNATANDPFPLGADSIHSINVDIHLKNGGKVTQPFPTGRKMQPKL